MDDSRAEAATERVMCILTEAARRYLRLHPYDGGSHGSAANPFLAMAEACYFDAMEETTEARG